MFSAPRLSPRLLDTIERLSRRPEPIAELNRRVGAEAERLGLPRPSYEQVRSLVHAARRLNGNLPDRGEVALDVLVRGIPTRTHLDQLAEPRARLRDRHPKAK